MEKYFLIGGLVVALVGAVTDVRGARIPNWLTYSGLVAALVVRAGLGNWTALKSGAAGLFIAGGIFLVLFIVGAMGGGDMKLMAAVGAWAGSTYVVTVLIAVALAGGVLALVSMILNQVLIQTVRNTVQLICYRFASGLEPHPELNVQAPGSRRVPFGVAIAMGTLFCAANAVWWR